MSAVRSAAEILKIIEEMEAKLILQKRIKQDETSSGLAHTAAQRVAATEAWLAVLRKELDAARSRPA